MEEGEIRTVVISEAFYQSLTYIFEQGVELFGKLQITKYENLIYEEIDNLSSRYMLHPECRYLPTRNKRYRNIILPAHSILYRITEERIEVLDIISYRESISHIKNRRQIKL